MKHTSFLKSLKALKSHLLQHKKNTATYTHHYFPNNQKPTCSCKDSKGETKYLYGSYKELEYLLANKEIKLNAYPCPYEKGWHLSKR